VEDYGAVGRDRGLALGAPRSLLHGAAEGPAGPFRAEAADRPRSIPAVRQLSQGGLQESGNGLPVRFACAGEHGLEQLGAGRDDLGCGPLATRCRPQGDRPGVAIAPAALDEPGRLQPVDEPHGAGMGKPQRAPDRVDVLAGVVRDYD